MFKPIKNSSISKNFIQSNKNIYDQAHDLQYLDNNSHSIVVDEQQPNFEPQNSTTTAFGSCNQSIMKIENKKRLAD